MAVDIPVAFTNYSGAYPNALAVNSSGAGVNDGTEIIATMINSWLFGPQQALLSRASLTPSGVVESASASQTIEAFKKGFNVGPGIEINSHLNDSFATLGYRALPLNGQGVLISAYPELDAVCYVGDANNPAVAAGGGAYYRADDAAGVTPNIAGIYLILPETRGYTSRGLDTAASVDPDGASRFLGDNQSDAMQRITGVLPDNWRSTALPVSGVYAESAGTQNNRAVGANATNDISFDSANSTSPNTAKTNDVETRMANYSVNKGIGY